MFRTQLEAAKAGNITPQLAAVAEREQISPQELLERVASGTVVIPANRLHTCLTPAGIGRGLRTKVNVNLGISRDRSDREEEFNKGATAVRLGADAVMDLSCEGDTRPFRRRLVESLPVMIGTVPAYDVVGCSLRALEDIDAEEWLVAVENHAKDGVDFMTIHAGLTRQSVALLGKTERLMSIVSRGGSLLYAWMQATGEENPYFAQYDRVLDICAAYDVTISLGDAGRPGCLRDATDAIQVAELITLGELVLRARERGVQVMVEGPGHVPLDQVEANVVMAKRLCHGAPFYVLGPLVTDVAPGYDHITSAIGGALAAAAGADFLCYVTPAEHLRLPTLSDMVEGLIAARIAAHAADLVKGVPGAAEWDDEMSRARRDLDWERMFRLALDPEKARRYYEESPPQEAGTCSMCGRLCAVRTMRQATREWAAGSKRARRAATA